VLDRWTGLQGGALEAQAEEARKGAIVSTVSRLLSNGLQIAVIATGATLIIAQAISPGVMIASAIILRRAVTPFERARSIWRVTVRVRKALDGITQLAKSQRTEQPVAVGHRIQPSLLVDRASVRYPSAASRVFNRLSFEIRPGETLCIAGGVGAGKSTLARLLVGAILPRSGRVLIGGHDTRQLDEDEIGSQIGYLPQDVEFCPGSIGQNIARLSKDNTASMREAARLAGIEEQIARLPEGFDTDIEEPGEFMSARLRRRIGLARALFGHPSLIVLDEPDPPASADDVAVWQRRFDHLRRRGATLVIFTNSVELMIMARRVMHIGEGKLDAAEEFSSTTVARLIERGCAVVVAQPRIAELATPQPERS
jgi:ATP-binding cassette subfamily C exporter for protease/lipase